MARVLTNREQNLIRDYLAKLGTVFINSSIQGAFNWVNNFCEENMDTLSEEELGTEIANVIRHSNMIGLKEMQQEQFEAICDELAQELKA
jgi:hypothetical protein